MKLPFEIDLKGKVAVVTGAGGVLCSMFAEALAKTGAKVALLDLNEEAAKTFAEKIVKDGGIATVPYKVICAMIKHPLTDAGIEKFMNDWNKMNLQ